MITERSATAAKGKTMDTSESFKGIADDTDTAYKAVAITLLSLRTLTYLCRELKLRGSEQHSVTCYPQKV